MRTKFLLSDVFLATSKDELRPSIQHVFFKGGFLYATDAHIAVKQSLKAHSFTDEEIATLDGKMMHGQSLKLIKSFKKVIVHADGVHCFGRYGETVIFKFTDEASTGSYPKVDAIIPTTSGSLSVIGINPVLLYRLKKCLLHNAGNESFKLTFGQTKTSAIKVTTHGMTEADQVAVIMPVAIND